MKHTAHKRIAHLKKTYKHIAAAFAGAILMSSALLPGIPVSTAHAAMKPNVGNTRDTSAQKMEQKNRVQSLEGKKGKKISSSKIKNTIRRSLRMSKALAGTSQPAKHESKAEPSHAKNTEKDVRVKPTSEKKAAPKAVSPTTAPKKEKKQEKKEWDSQKSKQTSAANPKTKKKQSPNAPSDYEKVLDIKATAYSPGPLDNDQWGDKTHLGTTIRPGVVAVDPKVIPLGSRLYVEYPDGRGEYAVAEDTGGAIKGNRIDIAMMDREKATEFGIKPVKVYVVSKAKE